MALDLAQKYLDLTRCDVCCLKCKGEIALINPKACEIFGYNERELIGMNCNLVTWRT